LKRSASEQRAGGEAYWWVGDRSEQEIEPPSIKQNKNTYYKYKLVLK